MEQDELFGLSDREIEILGILGFKKGEEKTAKSVIKDIITSCTKLQLHDKGIPLRSVLDIAKKLDIPVPQRPLYIRSDKDIDEELREMLAYLNE